MQLRLATDQAKHDHKSVGAYISPTAAPLDSDSRRQELFTLPAASEAALYVVPKLFCFVNRLFEKRKTKERRRFTVHSGVYRTPTPTTLTSDPR